MRKITIRDFATSFTATMFFVMATSGVMMYFHFMDKAVKELHEVLGLAFVAIVLLHIYVNWNAMKKYFSKTIFVSAVVIIVIVSSMFIVEGASKGNSPKTLVIEKVLNAPLEESLKLFGGYEMAVKKLQEQKIEILDAKSINAIAKANKMSPFKLISIITSK
jgi:hypothetical protein